MIQAAVLLPLGAALLIAPELARAVWPWALTPLTGRAVGAWLVGLGIAVAHAARENDLGRDRVMMLAYTALGLLELLALARYVQTPAWGDARAWLYLLFLVSILLVGAAGWLASTRAAVALPRPSPAIAE